MPDHYDKKTQGTLRRSCLGLLLGGNVLLIALAMAQINSTQLDSTLL